MVAGLLNPSDNTRATGTRPARTMSGAGSRRWFSDGLNTQVRDHDMNDLLGQIRVACDFYGVVDAEGDDNALQKAIAAAVGTLTGNIKQFQLLVGAADKVPYFTSAAAMSTFTATSFSRTLLAKTTATQWLDALGVSSSSSPNVVAFGALTAAANQIAYFTGAGAMALTNLSVFARTLIDDIDAAAARLTLGLGTAATQPTTAFATAADLALKAPLASPILTGVPQAPTATAGTSTLQIASTQFVQAAIASVPIASISGLQAVLDSKANLASPAFSGSPTAPTQTKTDNTTKIATDAFVQLHVTDINTALGLKADNTALALKANIASPVFTGTPTAPTATTDVNNDQIATTAFVQDLVDVLTGGTGTSSAYDIGTSGATIPLNAAANAPTGWASLSFSNLTGDRLALYSPLGNAAMMGFGIESSTLYYRSSGIHRWYIGTVADAGVTDYMQLATTGLTVTQFDDAATAGPFLDIIRVSTTAAANDYISCIRLMGHDSANNLTVYGQITTQILDPTDTSEDGRLSISAMVAGAINVRMWFGAGVYGPSSIDKGTDTLNFTTLYENGTSLAAKYAPIASPTFTTMATVDGGPLIVTRVGDAATAQLQIRADVGWTKGLWFMTGTTYRWSIASNNVAETGGSVGSDLEVYCYNDAGSAIGGPTLSIARTRIATFAVSPLAPTPAANDNTTKLATTAYVQTELADYATLAAPAFTGAVSVTNGDFTVNGGNILLDRNSNGAHAYLYVSGQNNFIKELQFRTGTDARWSFRSGNNAESTGNAGSDFQFYAFSDGGTSLGSVLTVVRATRVLTFTITPAAPTMATADSSTSLATTAYVKNNLASYATTASLSAYATTAQLALKADIASPIFTGNPQAPTPATADSSTSLATTAHVKANLVNYAALAGAAFTGAVSATSLTSNAGDIVLDRAGDAVGALLHISSDAGFARDVRFETAGANRWIFRTTGTTAEVSPTNVGADFSFLAFADAGSSLGSVFDVVRATRVLTFGVSPAAPTPAANDNTTKLATTAFVMAQDVLFLSNAANWAVSQNFVQGSTHGGSVSATRKATFDNNGNLTLNNSNNSTTIPLTIQNASTGTPIGVGIDFKMGAGLVAGRIVATATEDYTVAANASATMYFQYAVDGALLNAFTVNGTAFTFIHSNVVAVTPLTADNSTKVATTAFVKAQGYTLLRDVEEVVDTKVQALNDNIALLKGQIATLSAQIATR